MGAPKCNRLAIRDMLNGGVCILKRRDGQLRPPETWQGEPCGISALGECGDRKCANYRLHRKTALVRPSFLEWCVDQVYRATSRDERERGITYCSLGSGELYFDWELLERLITKESIRVCDVYLVDSIYQPGHKYHQSGKLALGAFSSWFDNT